MRRAALAAGIVFIAAAFAAATRVADTREGLIFEVITLFAGLAGVSLLLYGLVTTLGRPAVSSPALQPSARPVVKIHNAAELLVGGSGLVVAAILLGGIAATAGVLWLGQRARALRRRLRWAARGWRAPRCDGRDAGTASQLHQKLTPDTPDIGGHCIEAAALAAALDSLRHHQPQHDVDEDADALEEYQDKECNAHPERIQTQAFGKARAYPAEDTVVAPIEPLLTHALHVRPFPLQLTT